jgi:hypothetical protein
LLSNHSRLRKTSPKITQQDRAADLTILFTGAFHGFTGGFYAFTGTFAPFTGAPQSPKPFTGGFRLFTGAFPRFTGAFCTFTGAFTPFTGGPHQCG